MKTWLATAPHLRTRCTIQAPSWFVARHEAAKLLGAGPDELVVKEAEVVVAGERYMQRAGEVLQALADTPVRHPKQSKKVKK